MLQFYQIHLREPNLNGILQVRCTACGVVSNRYGSMMDLNVEIHGDAESLDTCLDQFIVVECLDGDSKYICGG